METRKRRLTTTGGDRATAYAMSAKVVRHNDRCVCTWLDVERQNRVAIVDLRSGQVVRQAPVGGPRKDNHCGAALAVDVEGRVHVMVGAHHGTFAHYTLASMADPSNTWTPVADGAHLGVRATYPSLARAPDGTLHLAYRRRNLPHYSVDYCRRLPHGQWEDVRVLITAAVEDHTWMTNALAVGPDGHVHLVVTSTLPLSNGAQHYGAAHLVSDDSGSTWRQLGDTGPLTLPVDVSDLKRIEGPELRPERIERAPTPWHTPAGPTNSYQHQLLLSNPVVDPQGDVWVILHNLLDGGAELCRTHGDSWTGTPLRPAVAELLPGYKISHAGQVACRGDGAIEVAVTVAPEDAPGWGAPGTALVRLVVDRDGAVCGGELVCEPEPDVACWLPTLERSGAGPAPTRPILLYTRGTNAGGYHTNVNELHSEVWLTSAG